MRVLEGLWLAKIGSAWHRKVGRHGHLPRRFRFGHEKEAAGAAVATVVAGE